MSILWAALLFLVVVIGWALNLFGLPGNWINLLAIGVYACLLPDAGRTAISWWVVGAVAGLAVVGEVLEFAAGAMGVAKVGGSRRGAVLALLGSIAGGILGAIIGIPIPVIGPIVAILIFGGFGALVGAALGERWKGRDWQASFEVGQAAFWGRLFGSLGKLLAGAVIVVVVLGALLFG